MSSVIEKAKEIMALPLSLKEIKKMLNDLGLTKYEINQIININKVRKAQERHELRRIRSANKVLKPKPERYMKCLAIRQPWATLIVSGIKDVELRNLMVPPCNKFLIAASVTRDADTLDEVLDSVQMNIVKPYLDSGALPAYSEWPTGSIIGWVEMDRATFDEVDSPWALGHPGIKYVIKHAYVFDTPIKGKNKATPFFYNIEDIDENSLPPYHQVAKM